MGGTLVSVVLSRAPTVADVRVAAARLAPLVRRTPTITVELSGTRVVCKLEHLQHGGSFKIRGALNRMLRVPRAALSAGVVTASGGNHGIGVALAAARLGAPATIFMPARAPAATERRIAALGARCLRRGGVWDEAWAEAEAHAAAAGLLAVHPFEDADVIAGQGTVGVELGEDASAADAVYVAIGGGGLAAGVAIALHAARPGLPIIGVEPIGAPSMHRSLAANQVVALDRVDTIAGTLAPRAVGALTRALCAEHLREIVLVSDEEMRAAMRWLWDELRVLVEPAGAAAIAALCSGRAATRSERPAVIVCGANPEDAEARRLFDGTAT
jgi:threonine dehydratase